MGLVDYASDDSDGDDGSSTTPQVGQAEVLKPSFQRVVDEKNPHKIRVNLPSSLKNIDRETSEPEPKRVKLGAGGRGGINSFLPAPKRPGASAQTGQTGTSRTKGFTPGISLKTGPEPGFIRGPIQTGSYAAKDETNTQSSTTSKNPSVLPDADEAQVKDVIPKGNATRFMPLSVSRKPKPKSKSQPTIKDTKAIAAQGEIEKGFPDGTITSASSQNRGNVPEKLKPKISLFSTTVTDDTTALGSEANESSYEPLLYVKQADDRGNGTHENEDSLYRERTNPAATANQLDAHKSLDSIASDLNLTASEKRQLFGREGVKKGSQNLSTAVNVVNFNTDAEYAANEELRAAGELPEQQHRTVRTVNTSGRNSLRSLVNVVATQGDALEEHFAKGRRNKQEAGSKYGW